MTKEEALALILKDPTKFFKWTTSFEPYGYQKEVLNSFFKGNTNKLVVRAGRQVGKSEVIASLALLYAILNEKSLVLITSATERQAKIIFDKIVSSFDRTHILFDLIEGQTAVEIRFKNKSKIICLPSGEGNTIRGFSPTLLLIDEAAFVKDKVFDALMPMLWRGAKFIMISTPYGKRGQFYNSFQDKNYVNFHITVDDCINEQTNELTKKSMMESLEAIKNSSTEMTWRQEYLAEFIDELDAFFPQSLVETCLDDCWTEQRFGKYPYYLGVDIAREGTDESAYVVTSQHPDGIYYVQYYETTSKTKLTDAMGRVLNMKDKWKPDLISMDTTGLGSGVGDVVNEKIKTLNQVVFTSKEREELYTNLKYLMEKGQIRFPHDKKLILQFSNFSYEYTSTGALKITKSDRGHDDIVDAIALSVYTAKKTRPKMISGIYR